MSNHYIPLEDLEVYKLARELSRAGWSIYKALDWETRKIMGHQFIESTDSFGSNIAEGYHRYHYLDKIKFFYNARASLKEADHWLELLFERGYAAKEACLEFNRISKLAALKLQNLIKANYKTKEMEFRNISAD